MAISVVGRLSAGDVNPEVQPHRRSALTRRLPFALILEARGAGDSDGISAVNRVVAGNSEAGKGWQETVVRHLTEEMSSPATPADPLADNSRLSSNVPDQSDAIAIIQRVSGLSIGELDRTIQELQKVRGFLASEGERMRREMADYLKLTQSAMSSTKAMADMIANFGSVVAEKPNP